MRTYRNGKPASNPKSLSRGVIKRDSKEYKTVERASDPEEKFAKSIKAKLVDTDGDGFKDSFGKIHRNPAVGKGYYGRMFAPYVAPKSGGVVAGGGGGGGGVFAPPTITPPIVNPPPGVSVASGLSIEIFDKEANILSRVGDPIGTIAFATDTFQIMVLNTEGFDTWSSQDHEILPSQFSADFDVNYGTQYPPQYRFTSHMSSIDGVSSYNQPTSLVLIDKADPNSTEPGAFLMSMWIKPKQLNRGQILFDLGYPKHITIKTDGRISWNKAGLNGDSLVSTDPLNFDQWNHVIFSSFINSNHSSSLGRPEVFINGSLDGQMTMDGDASILRMSTLGSLFTGNEPFEGKIDELAVWLVPNSQMTHGGTPKKTNLGITPADIYSSGNSHNLFNLAVPPTHWWRFFDGPYDTDGVFNDIAGGLHFYRVAKQYDSTSGFYRHPPLASADTPPPIDNT